MLIYGCPDGEGHWSNIANQQLVGVVRQKGKFDENFMTNILSAIRNAEQRLILVDVGGRRTSENERIFKECDGYIILSSKKEELVEWRNFGDRLGLKCIAELDSLLVGESIVYADKGDGILRGVVTGLERGEYVSSPVIDKLVERLVEIIESNGEKTLAEKTADVNGVEIADLIGIEDRNDPWMGYRPWHTIPTLEAVAHLAKKSLVKVWNIRSAFIASAICAKLRRSMVELFDVSLGYVMIPDLRPKGKGSKYGLSWKIIETDDYTVVKFQIEGGFYNPTWLFTAYPPRINTGKGVIVSGKGPIWLTATMIRAYSKTQPWTATFVVSESGREQPSLDGKKWDEVHPDQGPCVFVAGSKVKLGELIAIPSELLK